MGKTSIARHLEKIWQIKRISLDEFISQKAGQTIKQLVAEIGWGGFREREYESLAEVTFEGGPLLLDCGGGVIEGPNGQKSQEKIDILKNHYLCIYCYMNEEKLLERLENIGKSSNRPALSSAEETLAEILARRKPWYLEAAHVIVDTSDVSAFAAAERIAQLVRSQQT